VSVQETVASEHDGPRAITPAGSPPSRGWGTARRLAQFVLGIGALAFILVKSDARGLGRALEATRLSYLPLAFAATLAVTWLMAARWGLILRVGGKSVRTSRLFAYYLIGIFFSNFVPGGSVSLDVARLVYVDREIRDKPFVVSTLIYERFVGLFAVLLTGLVAMMVSRARLPEAEKIYAIEGILVCVLILGSALVSARVSAWLVRVVTEAGARLGVVRATSALTRVLQSISEFRRQPRMILNTVLLSLLIRVVWTLGCYVVALAMGLQIGLPLVFAFISIYDLIRMFPITVNGLGLREWALVALLGSVGVGREEALMFAFLAFAPILLNATIGGLIYTSRAGLKSSRRA
jgi:uncharacterized protein (TIRG00374 family)